MSCVNDGTNHFIVLDAVSRGMKSMGMIANVIRMEDDIAEYGKNTCLATLRGDCRQRQGGEKQ